MNMNIDHAHGIEKEDETVLTIEELMDGVHLPPDREYTGCDVLVLDVVPFESHETPDGPAEGTATGYNLFISGEPYLVSLMTKEDMNLENLSPSPLLIDGKDSGTIFERVQLIVDKESHTIMRLNICAESIHHTEEDSQRIIEESTKGAQNFFKSKGITPFAPSEDISE